jgi:ABC-type multidrug transport system permease subunit
MVVRTLSAWAIAFLVGFVFYQLPPVPSSATARINALLFLMCVFSLFCLPAVSKIIEDRLIFNRERASGLYSTRAYFLSTFLVELPILAGMVFGYSCIVYWMCNLRPDAGCFFFFVLAVFLVLNVGFSLSQAVASGVNSTNMAIALFMLVMVYSMLLGGFMIPPKDLPQSARGALKTSYFFFGFEALMLNEFKDKADNDGNVWGNAVLDTFEMSGSDKWVDAVSLLMFIIGLRLIAFLNLKYLQRGFR